MGGKDTQTNTQYVQSPEQRSVYQALLPGIGRLGQAMSGGQSLYNVPNIQSMMPQGDWWGSLDPNIKAGIMQPYQEGANQLEEQLLSRGGGSNLAGFSGAAANVLQDYWTKATPSMAQTGWNMIQPAQSMGWQAELQREQTPWSMLTGLMGGTYSTPVVTQQPGWGQALWGGIGQGIGNLPFML